MRKQSLTVSILTRVLILAWGALAVLASMLWMIGFGQDVVYVVLPLLVLCTVLLFLQVLVQLFLSATKWSSLFLFCFLLAVIQQLLGVFLPETSFDALWYHLPAIELYLDHGRLLFTPDLYQTAYPQFIDVLFLLGSQWMGMLGVKIVAYTGVLLLYLLICEITKDWKHITGRSVILASVALFQVVSWQAHSAYVDIWSAVFFLFGVVSLFQRQYLFSGFAWGVYVGSKFINLGFMPLLFILTVFQYLQKTTEGTHKKFRQLFFMWVVLGVLAASWHVRAWIVTGIPLYPMRTEHAIPVIQQMGVSGWYEWFILRGQTIYTLPYSFFISNREYFNPLFLPLLLLAWMKWKEWNTSTKLFMIAGVYGTLFWFFFPPPSSRYVLGQIVLLWVGVVSVLIERAKYHLIARKVVLCLLFCSILPLLFLRQFVLMRGILYLSGEETQTEYLIRFRDGFLDQKIDHYYHSP